MFNECNTQLVAYHMVYSIIDNERMETSCMQKLSVGDNEILAEMRKECIGIEHRGIFDCYT